MTAILVHAAWADASNWNKVLLQLRTSGVAALAAQIPLSSLSDDIVALNRLIHHVDGAVLLVAHSYGGAVITAASTNQDKVKGLVYIAAMAPDEGETVAQLLHRTEPHPEAPKLAPDVFGNVWMSRDGFANALAPESTPEEIFLMTAAQKPIAVKCITEPMTSPGWKQKRSWYLLARKDRIISPSTQTFMAERAKAQIEPRDVDHTPTTSAPNEVAKVIQAAAEAAARF